MADGTLRFIWELLFQSQFPYNRNTPLRQRDFDLIQQQVGAKLRELMTTDRDRAMIWRSLKTVQHAVHTKDATITDLKDRLLDMQDEVDRLREDMEELTQAERYRLSRLLPEELICSMPRDPSIDDVYEHVVLHIRDLGKGRQGNGGYSAKRVQDISVVISERDAAHAEIRVLQARLDALSSIPGRSLSSPHQLASSIAVSSSAGHAASFWMQRCDAAPNPNRRQRNCNDSCNVSPMSTLPETTRVIYTDEHLYDDDNYINNSGNSSNSIAGSLYRYDS